MDPDCAEAIIELLDVDLNQEPDDNDAIHLCGGAVLQILHKRPQVCLELADEKITVIPFRDVPECWRRLYEESSLWKLKNHLSTLAQSDDTVQLGTKRDCDGVPKEKSLVNGVSEGNQQLALEKIIHDLDMLTILTGAPGRRSLIDRIFTCLQTWMDSCPKYRNELSKMPQAYPKSYISLASTNTIPTLPSISLFSFQSHLNTQPSYQPIKFPSPLSIHSLPNANIWSNPSLLFYQTLYGTRLVPIELGRSYTDSSWTQRIMPFKEFLHTHLLNQNDEIGYLAQHDLLSQIPSLSQHLEIPDLCFAHLPLSSSSSLDHPVRNAWLGPARTISPLHTDPYHNILCQVVGRKYIRLYSPTQTEKLYPRTEAEEGGWTLDNTSKIDLKEYKLLFEGKAKGSEREKETFMKEFPKFKDADFVETILEQGEALYIPVGWWHYVESLEVSFSVSYWFD